LRISEWGKELGNVPSVLAFHEAAVLPRGFSETQVSAQNPGANLGHRAAMEPYPSMTLWTG